MNWMRIIDAVDAAMPDPTNGPRLPLRLQKSAIMVGAAMEMSPIEPSVKEVADYLAVKNETVAAALDRWRSIHWKDRYNWLRFVEGRITRETHTVDAALL